MAIWNPVVVIIIIIIIIIIGTCALLISVGLTQRPTQNTTESLSRLGIDMSGGNNTHQWQLVNDINWFLTQLGSKIRYIQQETGFWSPLMRVEINADSPLPSYNRYHQDQLLYLSGDSQPKRSLCHCLRRSKINHIVSTWKSPSMEHGCFKRSLECCDLGGVQVDGTWQHATWESRVAGSPGRRVAGPPVDWRIRRSMRWEATSEEGSPTSQTQIEVICQKIQGCRAFQKKHHLKIGQDFEGGFFGQQGGHFSSRGERLFLCFPIQSM